MIYLLSFAKSSRSSERNIVSPRKTSFKICRKNNSNESVKKPLNRTRWQRDVHFSGKQKLSSLQQHLTSAGRFLQSTVSMGVGLPVKFLNIKHNAEVKKIPYSLTCLLLTRANVALVVLQK